MTIYIREEAKRIQTTNWNNYCVDVRDLLQKFKGHRTLTTEKKQIILPYLMGSSRGNEITQLCCSMHLKPKLPKGKAQKESGGF
jgi:hypothetical protein